MGCVLNIKLQHVLVVSKTLLQLNSENLDFPRGGGGVWGCLSSHLGMPITKNIFILLGVFMKKLTSTSKYLLELHAKK